MKIGEPERIEGGSAILEGERWLPQKTDDEFDQAKAKRNADEHGFDAIFSKEIYGKLRKTSAFGEDAWALVPRMERRGDELAEVSDKGTLMPSLKALMSKLEKAGEGAVIGAIYNGKVQSKTGGNSYCDFTVDVYSRPASNASEPF